MEMVDGSPRRPRRPLRPPRVNGVDELLLSKIRLGVIAALLGGGDVPFSELQKITETTNGNLGAHLAKLAGAGYVLEQKAFVNRRPQTRYSLTARGRDAFMRHVRDMQSLLEGSHQ